MGSLGGPQKGPPPHFGMHFTPTIHNDTYAAIESSKSVGVVGKHVFITGASRGIGKAIAIAYAKAGASRIAIAARSGLDQVQKEIEDAAVAAGKEKPMVIPVAIDVLKPESVQQAFEKVAPLLQNRLDILVSNAGYMEDWKPIGSADIDDWFTSWDINVKGQFLVWKAALPLLLADETGLKTIVNLSSIGAHLIVPGGSAYQTAKLATLRLTEFLNLEYADKGLIAYGIHPGGIKTELAYKMPEAIHSKLIDTPELAADSVVYLTQHRREWLRGRYVSCTWDIPELDGMEEKIVRDDLLKIRMAV